MYLCLYIIIQLINHTNQSCWFPGLDFYLVIHNIDGTMLRNEKTQSVLSLLGLVPGLHILASVDHINSSLSTQLMYTFIDVRLC